MSAKTFNVLISSAGRRVALVEIFRRALADLDLKGSVFATDMSRLSSAFHLADRGFVVPPLHHGDFIPAIERLCREYDVKLIVPTIDTELPLYAEHRERFAAQGIAVAVSKPEVIAIGGDKSRTYAWLTANGFPTVRQTSIEDVVANPEAWPFPLLVKPLAGSASKGVATVHGTLELRSACRDGDYIVQTIARGAEFTVDVLVDHKGASVHAVPRKRLEVRAGEVSKGVVVHNPKLEDLARQVCSTLPGARGVLNVQIFYDAPSQALNVIEINPRFGGGFPLTWQAGGHYPRWMIEEFLGRAPSVAGAPFIDGLVMLRYDQAVFVERELAEL